MLILENLSETIDKINETLFFHQIIPVEEKRQTATWIAGLRGKTGAYHGMFAPTEADFTNGIRVFTGEPIKTKAGISHVLGEEACRALIYLDVKDETVNEALKTATQNMLLRLEKFETKDNVLGLYCCGSCSVAYWRHVIAGGLNRNEERLLSAMSVLKSYRTGDGHWRRFPFYYTLLALSEMDIKPALDEIHYAAPIMEKHLKIHTADNKYNRRRRIISERALAKC
jgi:hypothetical protein